jgi:diguanylate cyclase (GGDEF)-like protein
MSTEAQPEHLLEIIRIQNEIAAEGLDLPAVMDLVARQALRLTDAGGAMVEIADGDGLTCQVGVGAAKKHVDRTFPLEGTVSGLAVTSGELQSSDNTDSDERAGDIVGLEIGAGSMISAPISVDGANLGALSVYSAAIFAFRSKDIEVMKLLAGLISAAMVKAGDYRAEVRNSRTDPLTGLGNERAYHEALAAELSRARRHEGTVALCVFELVGLTGVNDELGHDAGDEAICAAAGMLTGGRFSDAAFRLENDHFALVLPETDESGAHAAGSRISARVTAARLAGGRITVRYGAGEGGPGAIELHERAMSDLAASAAGAGAVAS